MIVLKTFIITLVIMFIVKAIYEMLGTQMTYLSGNLGTSAIMSANVRTTYALIGMLITQLQIFGQDHKVLIFVSASAGCWIGTYLGNIIKERVFHKVVPYKFTITAKSDIVAKEIMSNIKEANIQLKSKGIKTIGLDYSPGHREDKSYTYITAMCYGKEHSKEIMKIRNKYNDTDALFMYDDSLKML